MADPTVVSGTSPVYGTGGDLAQRIVDNIDDRITWLGAPIAPFLRLSRMGGKESEHNQKFSVLEDQRLPRITRTNAGTLTSGATTLTFDNANYMRPNDVWFNSRMKERILISSNTATTAVVVRGYGTTAAAALLDNDEWIKIGVAIPETGSAVASRQTKVRTRERYCQFFSGTMDYSEISTHTKRYGMAEPERQRKNTSDDFVLSIESGFIFGEPLFDADDASPIDTALVSTRATCAGILYEIDTNASANVLNPSGGVLTQDDFWDWMADVVRDAPEDNKDGKITYMLAAGEKLINILNKWQLQFVQVGFDKEFGPNLGVYQTPHGRMDIMKHPLLKGDEYDDYGILVNKKYLRYAYLEGMDMKIKTNVQLNDSHTRKDEIYGVIGLKTYLPEVFGYVKNAIYAG